MTVSVRESSRRAGAAQVAAPVPEAPPAKAPASTEQVSISLPDLLEELKNHVGTEKQEGLQQLKQRAAEHPEEQVKLKRDILNLTGAEALRAAVTALMNKPKPPPPELLIPSLWAEGMSKEDFKAALVHSFHCRTPSCPVPDCASITSKLQRLHQHVSTCDLDNCLLCRMWTHLKYYRDSADPGGAPGGLANASSAALFTEPLINSSQLLPRWQQGAVAWMKPQEALAQVGAMTAHPGLLGAMDASSASDATAAAAAAAAAAATAAALLPSAEESGNCAPRVNGSGPPPKRRRANTSKASAVGGGVPAAAGPSVPTGRVARTGAGTGQFVGSAGLHALGTPGGAAMAYLSSLDAEGAGGVQRQRQVQEMLRLQGPLGPIQDLDLEAQMGGALRGLPPLTASGVQGGAGGVAGMPMCRCNTSGLSFATLGNLGASAGNLAEMLKSQSFPGGTAGIPMKGSRTMNASELSLGTFLENSGGDINDILNDFGIDPGPNPAQVDA